MSEKLAICLWFETQAEDAARFYTGLFPDSEMGEITRAPSDYPGGKAGGVLTADFTLLGHKCMALNGQAENTFSDAISFQVFTEDQAETDRYWNAILEAGGEPMACSWIKDQFGVRFQIVPRVLMEGLSHPDADVRGRVFAAMQEMIKIDVAKIEAALEGD